MKNAIQVYKETKHFNDLQLMDKEAEPEYPDEVTHNQTQFSSLLFFVYILYFSLIYLEAYLQLSAEY